jgi:site-specific recombinase XerD
MLKLYRRHIPNDEDGKGGCKHAAKGRKYTKCSCPIWVDGMREGKRSRYSLDSFNWEEASKRLLEITAGESKQDSTVSDAVKDFNDDCTRRGLKESGAKKYKELLNALLKFCEGRAITNVRALDVVTIKKFVDTFTESTLVQSKKIERLRTFFRHCEDMGWCESNPATKIKKPKVTNKPVQPFTAEQVAAIIKATDSYPEKNSFGHDNRARMKAFVLTLRYTGLRIGDTVKLSRAQVSNGRVLLHTQKTGAPIYLPLPKVLLDALKAIQTDSAYYFWTGTGGKGSLNTWDRGFRKVLKLAGVEGGHAHMFRHTLAIELLEKGITVEHVAAILGNSPAIVYKHYSPWVASRQKALDEAVMSVWV